MVDKAEHGVPPAQVSLPRLSQKLHPTALLLVGVGGMGGTLGRWGLDFLAQHYPLPLGSLEWSTVLVNVGGAFLLGFLTAALPGGRLKLLLGTGFLGAFTTYSTFSVALVNSGSGIRVNLWEGLLVLLCGVVAAWVGFSRGAKSGSGCE